MSGGGFILGGLLSGIGQGMSQDIQDRRAMALQNARAQAQAASDQRQADREEAKDTRTEERAVAADKRDYLTKKGILEIGGGIDIQKEKARTEGNLREIKAKGVVEGIILDKKIAGDKAITQLSKDLEGRNDRQSIELRTQLEGGQVQSTEQLADGRFYIVKKNGDTITTQDKGLIKASGDSASDTPLSRTGSPVAAKPAAAPARSGASTPAAAKPTGRNVLSGGEYQNVINQAIKKRSNGEPGFKGLNDAQLRKKLEDLYGRMGYDLPPV